MPVSSSGTAFKPVSRVLAEAQPGQFAFLCPGCKTLHVVPTGEGPGARWAYGGNPDRPSFLPSVLVRTGQAYQASAPAWEEGDPPLVCHSFVEDGMIRFLDDSTHELAGKKVDLPDIPL